MLHRGQVWVRSVTGIRGRAWSAGMGAAVAVAGLVGVLGLPAAEASAQGSRPAPIEISSTTTTVQAFMTLYGYVDNSPPGTDIAYPDCPGRSGIAGGVGTYADPITFATDVNEVAWCVIIYVPYMERYFIHEDECSECDANWNRSSLYRFDMWAGGDANSLEQPERRALLDCEDQWTKANSPTDPDNPEILVNPPSDLPVTTQPIFSPPTSCWQPISMTNPGNQTSVRGSGPVDLPIIASDSYPGQALSYSANGLPTGLSIDPTSGVVAGTPTRSGRWKVAVTASDAYNANEVSFVWVVERPSRAHDG